MIISDIHEIVVNPANIAHYSKFFSDLKSGQRIICRLEQLLPFSSVEIVVKCDECGLEKKISFKNYTSYGFIQPSYYCRKCNRKRKIQEKWGVDNVFQLSSVKEKIKTTLKEKWNVNNVSELMSVKEKKMKTNQSKYGVDWPQQSKVISEKTKKTLQQKFQVDNISKLKSIQDKKRKTHFESFGTDYVFQLTNFKKMIEEKNYLRWGVTQSFKAGEIKDKIRNTNLIRWGDEIASRNTEIKNKIKKSVCRTLNQKTFSIIEDLLEIDSEKRIFIIKCKICSNQYQIGYFLYYKRRETKTVCCTVCNPVSKHQSGLEIDLFNYINSVYHGKIIQKFRFQNKEIDIYLPELKIGFEFNGIYWHSELYKDKTYHYDKWFKAKCNSIKLFQIWEDDWLYKKEIVKSIVLNKIGLVQNKIYARKCEFSLPTKKEISEFLNENHLQGTTVFSYATTLSYMGELVSVMTFVKRKNYIELNRFCSIKNTLIIGAASKLLKRFRTINREKIVTFSDNSYSSGDLYLSLGFTKVADLKPDYYILENEIRRHKFNYRKRQIDFPKIWDAGKSKFSLSM